MTAKNGAASGEGLREAENALLARISELEGQALKRSSFDAWAISHSGKRPAEKSSLSEQAEAEN